MTTLLTFEELHIRLSKLKAGVPLPMRTCRDRFLKGPILEGTCDALRDGERGSGGGGAGIWG